VRWPLLLVLLVAAALAFVLALLPWGLRLLGWFGRAARAH
jgi:hypothetical protein